MGDFQIVACKTEFDGDIFDSFGEIRGRYYFENICGGEVSLCMPYLPRGIVSDLSVICDGVEFASAKAVNLREVSELPTDRYIALESHSEGLFVLKMKEIRAESLIVNVTVCVPLKRYGHYLPMAFSSPRELGEVCGLSVNFKVYGRVRKTVCPNYTVTQAQNDGFCLISAEDIHTQFALDILFSDLPENRLIISRQPLSKNIAFYSFTPLLEGISAKSRKFDIYIAFSQGNRLEIISNLAVFLRCLRKNDHFRLSIGENSTEFLTSAQKNIDLAMDFACGQEACPLSCPKIGDWDTVIISGGAAFDPLTELSGLPLVILSGEFAPWDFGTEILFAAKGEGEFSIPLRFSARYGKRLEGAVLQPLGGMGVEFFWNGTFLAENSVCNCFALHDLMPPAVIRILGKRKQLVSEIKFDNVQTLRSVRAINVMCWSEVAKELLARKTSEDKRCLLRQEANEIFIKNNIAFGDVGLVCVSNGKDFGLLSPVPEFKEAFGEKFNEKSVPEPDLVIALILKSQTADGVIADITVCSADRLIFSTAVCLIALRLYSGEGHRAFAKRSLELLKDKKGFWVKTALALWNGEEIDEKLLCQRAEMKIMGEHLYELAILMIKNYGRIRK